MIRKSQCAANEVSQEMSRERTPKNIQDVSVEKTLNLIARLIEKIEQQLEHADAKGSIADYIKLLQLQKELEEKRFRRIEVKWVDAE